MDINWCCDKCTYKDNIYDSRFCMLCGDGLRPDNIQNSDTKSDFLLTDVIDINDKYDNLIFPELNTNSMKNDNWICKHCNCFNSISSPEYDSNICPGCQQPRSLSNSNIKSNLFMNLNTIPLSVGNDKDYYRNKKLIGTFNENAFQLSLRRYPEDPLSIPIFSDIGIHRIPHIGIYCNEYEPIIPIVLIELPPPSNTQVVPNIWHSLSKHNIDTNNIEFYLMIHENPTLPKDVPVKQNGDTILNIILHSWSLGYNGVCDQVYAEANIKMGLFGSYNVIPLSTNDNEIAHDGYLFEEKMKNKGINDDHSFDPILFDGLDDRICVIHSGAFSPNNSQLILPKGFHIYSFWICAIYQQQAVISYHIISGNREMDNFFQKIIIDSNTLKDLLINIKNNHEIGIIHKNLIEIFNPLGIIVE